MLCHTGSQPGYKAHLAYVPERDVGVVILSNREDTRPTALAASIIAEVLGDDFPAPHPGRSRNTTLTAAEITAMEGSYVDLETGEWAALTVEDGILCMETLGDPVFLYDDGGGVFRDGDDYRATVPAELSIELGSGQREITCRMNLGGQRMTLRRCSAPSYAPDALGAFTGRYESTEIGSQHSVRVQDGTLSIEYGLGADRGLRFPMEPIAPDIFLVRPTAPGVAYRHVFRFERDSEGIVVSAIVTMERLKGLRLSRVV